MGIMKLLLGKICEWIRSPKRSVIQIRMDADVGIYSHKNACRSMMSAKVDHEWTYPLILFLFVCLAGAVVLNWIGKIFRLLRGCF